MAWDGVRFGFDRGSYAVVLKRGIILELACFPWFEV